MEWGSEDMTETDDSGYEDPDERANRLYVELNSEPTVQPGTVADKNIPTHGDEGDTYGPNELTGWTGCDADSPSGELSEIIDRPLTELVTARSGIDTDFPSSEHSELVGRPVTTDGPVSLGDTPPSSDSGIHSLEEQWENMSISTVDMESEQNGRPTNGSPTGRRGSDIRVPPNTEEEEDINCPWMDCLLEGESDELSSIDIPNYRNNIQYHCVTICKEENSSVNSRTHGGNSDIGVLADFSDDEEDAQYTPEMLEEIRHINEMGFQTDEDSPQWEQAFQQTMDADEDIPSCRDKKDNSGSQKQAGSDTDFPNGEHSEFVDRPVTESVTAQTESNTNFPSEEDSEFFWRPVTEPVTSRAGSDTDLPSDEHSEFFRSTGHGVGDGTGR